MHTWTLSACHNKNELDVWAKTVSKSHQNSKYQNFKVKRYAKVTQKYQSLAEITSDSTSNIKSSQKSYWHANIKHSRVTVVKYSYQKCKQLSKTSQTVP